MLDAGDRRDKSSKQRDPGSLGICRSGGVEGEKERPPRSCMGYNTLWIRPQEVLDGRVLNASEPAESRETDFKEGSRLSGGKRNQ